MKANDCPGTNDPDIVTSVTGNVFLAETPEQFTYDDDGNLLSDGRFSYTWDGDPASPKWLRGTGGRLIAVETLPDLPLDVPVIHVAFDYDYMSRRVGKHVYEWDDATTNWLAQSSSTFIYDSWNLVQEVREQATGASTNMFVWGIDLSGSLSGVGGVGGLLAILSPDSCLLSPVFDANGNVSEMLSALSSELSILAHYEYSPFGETIVATGTKAKDFAYRFSTKYTDDETKLVYYGYRYFSPSTGKWLSNDPLMDPGSPAVMMIKEQVLDALEQYFYIQLLLVLDEELPDEVRMSALYRAYAAGIWFDSVDRNEPNLWMMMAGKNWLMFCGNDGVNLFDLLGLECDGDQTAIIVTDVGALSNYASKNIAERLRRLGWCVREMSPQDFINNSDPFSALVLSGHGDKTTSASLDLDFIKRQLKDTGSNLQMIIALSCHGYDFVSDLHQSGYTTTDALVMGYVGYSANSPVRQYFIGRQIERWNKNPVFSTVSYGNVLQHGFGMGWFRIISKIK